MARQIADNLSYKGPKPLDNRLVVEDLIDLANFNENFCYDGMKVYVARRSAFYVYDSRNENAGTSIFDTDAVTKWRKGEDALHAKTEWKDSEDILPEGEGAPDIKMLEHKWYLELSRNKQTVLIFDNHAYSYITEVEGYNKDDEPCTYLIYQCTCTNVQTGLKPDTALDFAARVLEISSETMYKTGIQYHYAYHRTVSMGGGSLKYVSELPALADSSIGDTYALRAYKNVEYFRLTDEQFDAGSWIDTTGIYLASESRKYTWDEIIAANDGDYYKIADWFYYHDLDAQWEPLDNDLGLDDGRCVALYMEYIDADNPDKAVLCSRVGWEPRYADMLYVRSDSDYKRIRTDGEGGYMSVVYLTSDEYFKVRRGMPDALYKFDMRTIYVIVGKDEDKPEIYLANVNLCEFPRTDDIMVDCLSNGDQSIIRDITAWDPTNLSTAGIKGSRVLWDMDKDDHQLFSTSSYFTEARTIPMKIKKPDLEEITGMGEVIEMLPCVRNDYDHIVVIRFTSTQTSDNKIYSYVRRMAVKMGEDDETAIGKFRSRLPDECVYDSGWQDLLASGGGDGDLAKRLSNLGKESRIAATDKDDFYGLLWDIDMSKYSTSSSSRPTETRVLECVEYVPTSPSTALTEAVGGVATVTEVVTPIVSGEWDSYIYIEFRPHEFTKYSQTTFIRRIAVEFDTDKVGQFSKGILAFDLAADTGWVTSRVASDVKPDDRTIEMSLTSKLQIKNEGVTKSKINSEAGVVFEDDTQELTNKTIDATKNTFKNLSLTAFGDNLIDKSALTTTDDNHLATSKLIKNYADLKITIPSTRADKVMAWNSSGNTRVLGYKKQYEHFFAVKRTSYSVNYITFSYIDTTPSPTVAQMIKWIHDNGFTSQNALYPASGLAAANTIYVASSSGGANTTSFSATSCINGIFSSDGTTLKYTYRAGTDVTIDAARLIRITSIDRGYILTD